METSDFLYFIILLNSSIIILFSPLAANPDLFFGIAAMFIFIEVARELLKGKKNNRGIL